MNLKEWSDQIESWKQQYGVPAHGGPRRFRPEEVKLACAKCTRLRHRMSRHHKMNDYMFACLMPDIYAKRYIEFRSEDIDKLCERCHKRWHVIIKPVINMILKTVTAIRVSGYKLDVDTCEAWRKIILTKYENWLNTPIPKRKHAHRKKRKRKRRKVNPS